MKKRILSMIIAIVMVVGLVPSFAIAASAAESYSYPTSQPTTTWAGNGTEADPYVITTAQQLADLAWFINNNKSAYYSKHYKLGNDIDLSGGTWTVIGFYDGSNASQKRGFKGIFDGNGKTISGLNNISTEHKTMALFGYLDGGTIKNLTVSGAFSSTASYNAGICGRSSGSIYNCTNNVNITVVTSSGIAYAGGIAAYCTGNIGNCKNNGNLTADTTVNVYTGGICAQLGASGSTLSDCTNTGTITGNGNDGTGGICGALSNSSAKISNCTNSGTVYSSGSYVGGIIGAVSGTVEGCTNSGNVSVGIDSAGGICGYNKNNSKGIINCSNSGTISAPKRAGGISGYGEGPISKCYNAGAVSSTNTTANAEAHVGGIEGLSYGSEINNCYNIGAVSGGSTSSKYVGGISGQLNSSATVENCFNTGTISNGNSTYRKAIAYKNSGTITNCYFLRGKGTDGNATSKDSTAFSDGSVTKLLQSGNLELVWGQTINTDTYPVFYNGSNALGVDATGVTVNPITATIGTGNTVSSITLVATVSPINANEKTVTWASSNNEVATVVNGVVTAVSKGTAIITATSTDGGFTATCTVTVCDHVGSTHSEYDCANRQHTYTCSICNLDVTVDCAIDTASGNCSVCGTNVAAVTVTIGNSTTYYKELGAALAYVSTLSDSEKVFIQLVAESSFDGIPALPARTIELDLNGNTASVKNLVYSNGTDLIVKDTSTSQVGKLWIVSEGGGVYTEVVPGAKLTLESGTIDGSVEHTINGTFVMTGGTIQGTWAIYVRSATASVTITGGTLEGTNQKGLYLGDNAVGANISISGGTFINGIRCPSDMTFADLIPEKTVVCDANGNSYAEEFSTMETLYVFYLHTHEWTYTANGDTITATCANTDGACGDTEQSIVIEAPYAGRGGLTFDNTVKAATISGTIEDVEIPEIVYTLESTGEAASPFAPGVYVASITIGTVTATCEFEIAKGSLSNSNFVYDSATTVAYDGTGKSVSVTPTNTIEAYVGAIEVLYDGSAKLPINVGSYAISINVAESEYYTASTIALRNSRVPVMLTISAKDISDLTFILEDSYSMKDGAATPDVTIQYNGMTLVKDTDYTIAYVNNTAPGTATMTITGIGNYTGTKTLEFNITSHTHNYTYTLVGTDTIKATCPNEDGNCTATEQTVKLVAPSNLVYTGTAKTATVEGTIGGNIPEITYEGDCKSLGSHTASIMIGGVTARVSFTITECPHESYTDGDCDHCDYVCTHSTMTYNDNGDDTHTKNCPVCQYSASENHDHTNGKCVCGKKATPTYTAPAGLTATYGQTLAEISLPAGFSWQDEPGTPVGNVGTRTFKVTFTPDDTDNYEIVTDIEVTIAVEKATPTVSLTSPIDQVMGGYSIELSPTSDATEVNTFEIIDGEGYSVNGNVITIDDGVVVGTTLTVKYRSVATENYESVEGEITLTVGVPTVDTSALENAIDALEGRIEEIEAEFGTDGEVTKLREELDALKEAVSKLDNGYATDAELAETIGNVNNTITSLTTRVKNLEDTYATKAEVNALKQDLDDQYEKLVDLINANTLEIGTINTTLGQINTTLTTLATKTDVESEISRLGNLITALTTRVSTTETAISANAGEISSLKTTVEALTTELRGADDTFTDSVNGLSDALTTLTGRVDTAEQEIDALQQELASKYAELSNLINANTLDISAINTTLGEINTTLTTLATKTDVATEVATLTGLINALTDRVTNTETGVSTNAGEISSLKTTVEALATELRGADDTFTDSVNGLSDALTTLTGRVDTAEQEIDALQQELASKYAELSNLINANTLDISAINTTLGEINTTLTTLATKTDVATEVATLTGLINALTERVTNTETGVSTNAGEISSLKTTVEALTTELRGADETLTNSVNSLSLALTTLTGRVDTAEQEIDKLQQDLADAIKDLDAAMKKGDADLSAEIASLNTALTNAKAALEKADADNKAELIKKIEEADKALDDAIKTVQKNLDDAKTELDKAIKDGDTALDTKITNLNTALTNAVAALEKADTDNKAELVKKIEDADASLQAAIDKVASDLTKAQKDLADAIATGDAALSSRISSVSASLSAAKAALEKADSDNKAALEAKIEATEATLDAAIKAVQKNLDDAKAELNKAIADGDTELDGKISALGEALATAKAALETTDSANKSELTTKIDEADAALHAAINALSNELNATNEKVAALETFIIIVCVISGVAFCGCGTLAVFYIIDKRKKI